MTMFIGGFLVGAGVTLLVLIVYSCCVVSGRCSQQEREAEKQIDDRMKRKKG